MRQFKIRASEVFNIMGIKGLGETGKTYCENWVKEQLYGKKKEFTSKYTDKGLQQESAAIDFAAGYFGWGMITKNEQRFTTEFMEGTPDIVLAKSIEDIKCSWDCFTFPKFDDVPDKKYVNQLQVYMHVTDKQSAGLVYTLMDAPESLIESEARKLSFAQGFNELSAELYEQVRAEMSYSHLGPDLRIKRFEIPRNDETIGLICQRVTECRNYIGTIWPSYAVATFDEPVNATLVTNG